MNVDNSVLHGNKGLLKCDRERQDDNETGVYLKEWEEEEERQRSESF